MNIEAADLQAAYDGSWYWIGGTGGDLTEWVDGYNEMLEKAEMRRPTKWVQTTGAEVNAFVGATDDPFQPDLPMLMFPLDGLDIGRLAMFKLRMGDRWFDDVVENMRAVNA